jgi:hypothetical protein
VLLLQVDSPVSMNLTWKPQVNKIHARTLKYSLVPVPAGSRISAWATLMRS